MRIVFMGTDRFAVPSLKMLSDSKFDIACVITQPDHPKGRGLKLAFSPVKEAALNMGLIVYQPQKIRDIEFVAKLQNDISPDLIIVSAFGQILSKALLDMPVYGCINLHPSLLPKYRGAAPIQRAIMNGESETGVTIMFMDEGEDTGDIIVQESIEIRSGDNAESLSAKLADLSAKMLFDLLNRGSLETLPRQAQDPDKVIYAPKLSKDEGLIDWSKSSLEIHNLIRGTLPWPGAYIDFDDKMLKIWESKLPDKKENIIANAGTIIKIIPDSGIMVATGDGAIIITVVQPTNKSKMKAKDFVNGYRLKPGDRLGKQF